MRKPRWLGEGPDRNGIEMHIKVSERPGRRLRRLALWALPPLAVVGAWFWGTALPVVERDDLWIEEVRQGELEVTVSGHGSLKPLEQRWLIAETPGTIEQILLQPGAAVAPDSVILKLSSPALDDELRGARLQLAGQEAEIAAALAGSRSELLAARMQKERAVGERLAARLEFDMYEKLLGQMTVSKLQFEKARLQLEQAERAEHAEAQRLRELEQIHQSRVKALAARVEQQREQVRLLEQRQRGLALRAGAAGMLMQLADGLEPGRAVAAGTALALVGRLDRMYAELRVPAVRAGELAVGMPASVDLRDRKMPGRVVRIDPRASNDQVVADIALDGELPDAARPELPVSAEIRVRTLGDVVFVRAPPKAHAGQTLRLYVGEPGSDELRQADVVFGEQGGGFIVVREGLRVGQMVVLSDLERFAGAPRLRLQSN